MHVGRVMLVVCLLVFSSLFFFKQKTAYDMRISDWSSDVCFSDLVATSAPHAMSFRVAPMTDANAALTLGATTQGTLALPGDRRSAERRVGTECVTTCRSRRSSYH